MTQDDGSTTATLAATEAAIVCEVLRLLVTLAQVRIASDSGAPAVDLDDLDVPALRVVLDDGADMLTIGVVQADGTVKALAGYHLSAARQIAQQAAGADGGTTPAAWH